ncbi:MAG: hypothetical protein NTY12_03685 [Candidatus Falkowbacteria bacterium]|nr:hypothetical protein [Candidatus Falkowbacteria bacterium]
MEHLAEDTLVLEKPKKEIALESAVRKFPDLSSEDRALLSDFVNYFNAEFLEHDVTRDHRDSFIDKMKTQAMYDDNSSLAGALIEYVRLANISSSEKLFNLIGTLKDFYDQVHFFDKDDCFPKGAAASISKILGQDLIWHSPNGANRCRIFDILGFYDLENLPYKEKAEINKQLDDFINNVKKSRVNSRRQCVEDIELALMAKQRMFDYPDSLVGSATQIIATETDDTDWPSDPLDSDQHIQNKREVYKPSQFSEDFVKAKVKEAVDLANAFNNVPEKIKPALQLHYFNNLIAIEKGNGANLLNGTQEKYILGQYAKVEKQAEENMYLPTVGLEIEVPYGFKVDKELCEATKDLGIPQAGTGGTNETWEFASDFSYSAKTQTLIAHELIRGDFIETEGADQSRKIRGDGDFSMHLNLGFPLDLAEKISDDYDFKSRFKLKADVLVNALTYAFVSPKRLVNRKTSSRMNLDKTANKAGKKITEAPNLDEYNSDIVSSGRLEIRSLEVRDATLYRLVPEAQVLAAALFSSEADKPDKSQEQLKNIWEDFSVKVQNIFTQFNLTFDTVDEKSIRAAKAIDETSIQNELRALITQTAQAINHTIHL